MTGMSYLAFLFLLQSPASLGADSSLVERAVLVRPLSAGSIITQADLVSDKMPDDELIGMETRRYMPIGSAVQVSDLRAQTLIKRNAAVRIAFDKGRLSIVAEGRALSNGARGDTVRVLNLSSKSVVFGVVVDRDLVQVK